MRCRIAGFIGCAPFEVEELPAGEYDLLIRFWDEDPWGSWRDNLHAAIIARETLRGRVRGVPKLQDFFYRLPERQRRKNLTGFVEALKAMAGGKRIHASEYRPPKRRRKNGNRPGKASSPPRGAVVPTTPGAREGKPKDRGVRR